MTTTEEFRLCDSIAQDLLKQFGDSDSIPCFVVKEKVMEKFGFSFDENGKVPVDVVELVDWVFQAAHDS